MNVFRLALLPLVGMVGFLVAAWLLPEAWGGAALFFWAAVATRSLAAGGEFLAGSCFRFGDLLRWGWWFWAFGDACLVLRTGIEGPTHFVLTTPGHLHLSILLLVLANLAAVLGALFMARVWFASGLARAFDSWRQIAWSAVVSTLALLAVAPLLARSARATLAGDSSFVLPLLSASSDLASLLLVSPMLLLALSVRGGRLAWSWGLVVVSFVGWMFVDLAQGYGPGFLSARIGQVLENAFAVFASLAIFAAGLAQRWAVSPAPGATRGRD